jgi:hypothetical protein
MRNARLSVEGLWSVLVHPGNHPRSMSVMRRSGALWKLNQDGHRWALLTTKSRKTWTRATVFNSSG